MLIFEPGFNTYTAVSARVGYCITRFDGGWLAHAAVEGDPDAVAGATVPMGDYERHFATIDGAMLACRTAERDGFDSWSAGCDTPNTRADGDEPPQVWTAREWALAGYYLPDAESEVG
jgi:hypothetical protein